jgi:hypothetical protein
MSGRLFGVWRGLPGRHKHHHDCAQGQKTGYRSNKDYRPGVLFRSSRDFSNGTTVGVDPAG